MQTTFNAPAGNEPLALDLNTMGKGQVWINGQSIGRYWPGYKASGNCGACNYAGWFDEKKCLSNCGEASQRWYVMANLVAFSSDVTRSSNLTMNYNSGIMFLGLGCILLEIC